MREFEEEYPIYGDEFDDDYVEFKWREEGLSEEEKRRLVKKEWEEFQKSLKEEE